jgi:phosphoglycolate phosphatase
MVRLGFADATDTRSAALRQRYLEVYAKCLAEETRLFDGLDAALNKLEAAGIPWGIVTNKPGWLTRPLLEQLKLHHRARVVVSGDTLPERKPHPAPLLHAAKGLGISPAECIYIGDAERDALAARAAGMKMFVALFGYIPTEERPGEWPATGWLKNTQDMVTLLERLTVTA